MAQKKARPIPSPPPEHQWTCLVEGCGYVLTFTTEQSDVALDQMSTHKAGHLLEHQPPTEPEPQPPSPPSSALETAMVALLRTQGQTQQLLGAIAQSSQANAEAVGQLAASMSQLNQMILDSRKPAESDGQGVAPQAGQKGWGAMEIAQLASALGIGRSGTTPMDGLNQFRAMLDGILPILNWHESAMFRGFGMATETFTRSVRAGMTPDQAAEGLQKTLEERTAQLKPPPQAPAP